MKAWALKSGKGIVFDSLAKTRKQCAEGLCLYDRARVDAGIYKLVKVEISIIPTPKGGTD